MAGFAVRTVAHSVVRTAGRHSVATPVTAVGGPVDRTAGVVAGAAVAAVPAVRTADFVAGLAVPVDRTAGYAAGPSVDLVVGHVVVSADSSAVVGRLADIAACPDRTAGYAVVLAAYLADHTDGHAADVAVPAVRTADFVAVPGGPVDRTAGYAAGPSVGPAVGHVVVSADSSAVVGRLGVAAVSVDRTADHAAVVAAYLAVGAAVRSLAVSVLDLTCISWALPTSAGLKEPKRILSGAENKRGEPFSRFSLPTIILLRVWNELHRTSII